MQHRTKRKALPKPITLRGRKFTGQELELITRCVDNYSHQGRTAISKIICEQLNWRQPNGWTKDRACRDVLKHLEEIGYIKLPPSKTGLRRASNSPSKVQTTPAFSSELQTSPVTRFPQLIALEFAKGNSAEKLWNQLVDTYHYLGHRVIVGRCIKYLVKGDGLLVGAIAFSSPAWQLAPRDQLLSTLIKPEEMRELVINNSRFLILPNVDVPNLASAILALATKRVVKDWTDYYSITPQIAETFVEPSRFLGTCYRAANWLEIGTTKGYGKSANTHHNSQEPKQIFLYGLSRYMRRELAKISRKNIVP